MFNTYKLKLDPDPYQGSSISKGLLAITHLSVAEQKPVLKRLGPADMELFLQRHTETRNLQPEDEQDFMKELTPELLEHLMKKKMTVLGLFIGEELVSGCVTLDPADPAIKDYLTGYEFDGKEARTAVISAVWTHPDHTGKGYSKKVVDAAMGLAVLGGKDIFRAKVDKGNGASLSVFNSFTYDTTVEGCDPRKVYPLLAL